MFQLDRRDLEMALKKAPPPKLPVCDVPDMGKIRSIVMNTMLTPEALGTAPQEPKKVEPKRPEPPRPTVDPNDIWDQLRRSKGVQSNDVGPKRGTANPPGPKPPSYEDYRELNANMNGNIPEEEIGRAHV